MRLLLERRGWPQNRLSEELDGKPSMVNSWVKGRNLPSLRTFIRIADVLDLSRREIVAIVVDVFDLRTR